MNSRSTILEIATTSYEAHLGLISSAMDELQTLCGLSDGFLISEPLHRFGWTFFKILLKNDLWAAMPVKFADKIQESKGKSFEEKLVSFMTKFFEQRNAKVKVKLTEV